MPSAADSSVPSLDIVIVNWNSGRQLERAIASVDRSAATGVRLERLTVVDNASTDGSLELPPGMPALDIVRNTRNTGFAAACNQGVTRGRAEFVLLLNPDMELSADSLSRPAGFLASTAGAGYGIAGIQLLDEDGRISRSCARLPAPGSFASQMLGLDQLWPRWFPSHIMAEWDHRDSRDVDHVIGAFYLVRRSVWESLGGFDERFFVYLEDLDFSWRARAAGWRTRYLADVRAVHRGGGTSIQVKAARLAYALHSRILFGFKHFNLPIAVLLAAGTLGVEPLIRLIDALVRGPAGRAREVVQGCSLLWRRTLLGRGP